MGLHGLSKSFDRKLVLEILEHSPYKLQILSIKS